MAESPTCPTSKCPDKGKPMQPANPRRYDHQRKITRYKCPTCEREISKRAA